MHQRRQTSKPMQRGGIKMEIDTSDCQLRNLIYLVFGLDGGQNHKQILVILCKKDAARSDSNE